MLKTRILTAAVLIPAVLAALFLLSPKAWALVALVVIAIAAFEWERLTGFTLGRRSWFVGGTIILGLALLFSDSTGFARGWPDTVVLAVCGPAVGSRTNANRLPPRSTTAADTR